MDTRQVGTADVMAVDAAKNPYALLVWGAAFCFVALGGGLVALVARRKTPQALEKSIAKRSAKLAEEQVKLEDDKKELARIQAEAAPKQE